jgi:hypothetical protein
MPVIVTTYEETVTDGVIGGDAFVEAAGGAGLYLVVVTDGVIGSDPSVTATGGIGIHTVIITDGVIGGDAFVEATGGVLANVVSVSDGLIMTSIPVGDYLKLISDGLLMSTSFIGGYIKEVIENITASTAFAVSYGKLISETINLHEDTTAITALLILERFGISSEPSAAGSNYHATALQKLRLEDLVIVSWFLVVVESTFFTASATQKAKWVRTIVEKLKSVDTVEAQLKAVAASIIDLVLTDAWESGKGADGFDALTFSDAVAQKAIMLLTAIESAQLATTADNSLTIISPAFEKIDLAGVSTPSQVLQQLLSDGIVFDLSFGLDGNLYTGWVMNVDNFALSEYQNYPFNSFAKIGEKYYGANDNGIYLLEGSSDAGDDISATFTTGKLSFKGSLSRVANAYLALRNDGNILLKTIADDDTERWYELNDSDWTLRDKRVKMGRGIKSRYWQFTIANANGADFELAELVLLPIILKRR